jgi:hypothetical protein
MKTEAYNIQRVTRTIATGGVGGLKAMVKRLNRRARRNGLEPLSLTLGSTGRQYMDLPVTPTQSKRVLVNTIEVTLTGNIPLLPGGWRVVAMREHKASTGVVTWLSYNRDENPDTLPVGTMCDHCNAKRNRRLVFYVRNEDGKLMRVGSQCVKDFVSNHTPTSLAFIAEAQWLLSHLREALDSEGPFGPQGATCGAYDSLAVLCHAIEATRQTGGYISRDRAQQQGQVATASTVIDQLDHHRPHNDDHIDEAREIIEYLRTIDGENEYTRNLVEVAKADAVDRSHVGILASGVAVWRRHLDEVALAQRLAEMPDTDTHVGNVGERVTMGVTLESVRASESYYGQTHIHTFRTLGGACVVWFSTAGVIDAEPGQEVEIVATVKRHGEYRGQKQTTVNRVKVA